MLQERAIRNAAGAASLADRPAGRQRVSDYCVIGSGPSAVSAAVALTRRNLRVTMLDAGRSLDHSRVETVGRMRSRAPEDWNPSDVESLKEGIAASARGIPLKRLYGSDFQFSTEGSGVRFEYANAGVRPSFARGGLSNVWGGGLLPFHKDDIAGWPFDASELERHYSDVLSFVPCSAPAVMPTGDSFESLFPHHCGDLQPMPLSRQAQAILRDAARSSAALNRSGVFAGRARLAVDGRRCERCGLCLYGCPYGLIYNSETTLAQLRALPNFRYEPGFVVERLEERNGKVRIEGHDLAGGARREVHAGRVLLGAGVVPSTAILLASLGEFGAGIRLQDSFYFLLPLLRFAGVDSLPDERLHTLAQAFIAIRDPAVCEPFVLFSVYGFNDLTAPMLQASIGKAGSAALVSRTLAAGGYLHSSLSPGIWMTVERGRIALEGEDSAGAIATAKRAAWKLLRQSWRLRTVPVVPAMRFFPPGRGFHTGGSFPMRKNPASHTSDTEGRPFGFERVHLVDASCLPSIPATTITLPVMANAWRIANRAADRA